MKTFVTAGVTEEKTKQWFWVQKLPPHLQSEALMLYYQGTTVEELMRVTCARGSVFAQIGNRAEPVELGVTHRRDS
jgi:hypothetical protein